MRKQWWCVCASFALVVGACSDGGGAKLGDVATSAAQDGGSGDGAPWTVFVYMAADNNLEVPGVLDIMEMVEGVGDNMNLLVLMDRAAEDDAGGYTGHELPGGLTFSGAHLLHITKDGVKDVQDLGPIDMTDPAMLSAAGASVFKAYPAEHTALVLWDHGGGWHGYAADDSTGSGSMSAGEVQQALQGVLDGAGMDKFSLVVFDACLMADLEIASGLAPVTDRLMASEEVVPGHGLDYSVLAAATSGDVQHFYDVMAPAFQAQSVEWKDEAPITMSLFDLTKVGAVVDAVIGWQSAVASDPAASVEFLRAVDKATMFGFSPSEGMDYNMRDLGQIAESLAASGGSLAAPAGSVLTAVDDMVLDHLEGPAHAGAHGLSVYAPLSIESFDTRFPDVADAAPWAGVLDAVYNGGADTQGGIDSAFVATPQAEFDPASGLLSIVGAVAPEAIPTIVSVRVFYGAFVPAQDGFPDLVLALGRRQGQILDPTSGVIGGNIPLLQLGLSVDGGSSGLLGMISPIPGGDGSTVVLSVPVRYMAPGQASAQGTDGYLLLTLDASGNVVGRSLMLFAANGTLAQATPDPAGTIQTLVPQLGADGSSNEILSEGYTDPPSLPAGLDNLSIVVNARQPGDGSPLGDNLGIGVAITDAAGVVHFTFAKFPG